MLHICANLFFVGRFVYTYTVRMQGDSAKTSLHAMRLEARRMQHAGRLVDAINQQLNLIRLAERDGAARADDYHVLGVMFFAIRDYPNAANAFGRELGMRPGARDASMNLGLSLVRCQRLDEGIRHLENAADRYGNDPNLLDGMADAYWKKGDWNKARLYGEKSLRIKDIRACAVETGLALATREVPPFRPERPIENIISFSLYGGAEQYHVGAIRNVEAAAVLYPEWRCRFYCDPHIPGQIVSALRSAGAQIVTMPRPGRPADGLFWRFLVADDPGVARFLVRDCDSIVNRRERCAVQDWLRSGRSFHVMRDNGSHTALIMAGMWGGVAGRLPPLSRLLKTFVFDPATESRTADQCFLGRVVWPLIKKDCIIHDSIYRNFGARDFPPGPGIGRGRHVGDNDYVIRRLGSEGISQDPQPPDA